MNGTTSRGYSGLQIALHWIVVALVAFQLVFGEDMADLFDTYLEGGTASPEVARWGNLHIWAGFAILAAVLIRLALRARRAPPPEEGNPILALLARITHLAFYAILVLMPITGGLAYYLDIPALGEIHELGKPLLLALIALHVIAALWHQFIRRDGLITRIIVPR